MKTRFGRLFAGREARFFVFSTLAILSFVVSGCEQPAQPGSAPGGTSQAPGANTPSAAAPSASAPAANAPAASSTSSGGQEATRPAAKTVRVVMETSMGTIELELDRSRAPITVDNFVRYVKKKHYDGTIFHRVIPGFMIQGGGFTPEMQEKPTDAPIKNEAGNGLKNLRGTIAMARTSDPDSATAQFFINLVDNGFLDRNEAEGNPGYAVFGKVTRGMDVVDRIARVETHTVGPHENVPVKPVVIRSVRIRE